MAKFSQEKVLALMSQEYAHENHNEVELKVTTMLTITMTYSFTHWQG